MSDNAINIPGNVSSDMQKESSKPLFTLQRGATRREVNAVEARHFVQGILSRSINLATLIGSGASTPAIPLMGETFRNLRADLKLNDPDLSILLESRITKIACRDNEDPAKYSNIENLLSWLSQRIEGSLDSADDDKRVSDAVRKAFLESVDIKYSAEHSDVLDAIVSLFRDLAYRDRSLRAVVKLPSTSLISSQQTTTYFMRWPLNRAATPMWTGSRTG